MRLAKEQLILHLAQEIIKKNSKIVYGTSKKTSLRKRIICIERSRKRYQICRRQKMLDKVVGNIELEISAIEINPFQPRSNFNEESLRELATEAE
jgi:hypothetical protein